MSNWSQTWIYKWTMKISFVFVEKLYSEAIISRRIAYNKLS